MRVRRLRRLGRPDAQRQDAELFARAHHHAGHERRVPLHPPTDVRGAAQSRLGWVLEGRVADQSRSRPAPALLLLTALRDEAECLDHFGVSYAAYMKTSKRFVPFIFW